MGLRVSDPYSLLLLLCLAQLQGGYAGARGEREREQGEEAERQGTARGD
jgi:hypothetical protein